MKTSVVLATYNGQHFIEAQIRSLLEQDLPPDELIVTDDQSSDGTLDLIADLCRAAPFKLTLSVNPTRLGFEDNFMRGVALASGDIVLFCDQDDVWHPRKVSTVRRAFDDPDIMLCAHRGRLIDATGAALGHFDQGISGDAVVGPLSFDFWMVYYGFSIACRRTLFGLVEPGARGTDMITGRNLAHDRWALFLANNLGKTRLIGDYLVDYRQHGSNLFGARRGARMRGYERLHRDAMNAAAAATSLEADLYRLETARGRDFPLFDLDRSLAHYKDIFAFSKRRLDAYDDFSPLRYYSNVQKMLFAGDYSRRRLGSSQKPILLKDLAFGALKVLGRP